jgi:hypothetical protein
VMLTRLDQCWLKRWKHTMQQAKPNSFSSRYRIIEP